MGEAEIAGGGGEERGDTTSPLLSSFFLIFIKQNVSSFTRAVLPLLSDLALRAKPLVPSRRFAPTGGHFVVGEILVMFGAKNTVRNAVKELG